MENQSFYVTFSIYQLQKYKFFFKAEKYLVFSDNCIFKADINYLTDKQGFTISVLYQIVIWG